MSVRWVFRTALAVICAFGVQTGSSDCRAAEAVVTATAVTPAHALLIRNEQGAMLRVTLDAGSEKGVQLKSLAFELTGTDDIQDIDALTLLCTEERDTFTPNVPCGESQPAAARVVFRPARELKPGRNVFWLSGRLKPTASLSRRVGAVCVEVETSAGRIVPMNSTPGRTQRIGMALRRHKDDGVHTYRIPALTTSAKGTLLCAYDMRRRAGRDLQEDIDIGLSRSVDGGQTWEPVRVIMDMGEYGGLPQEQNGCSDPGLIVDHQTGEIFCFAVWMNGKPGKHQWVKDGSEPGYEIGRSAQFLVVRSMDDGRTWSKPENWTRTLKKEAWWLFAPAPQQGIQLADGTLVMPSQGRDETGRKFSTIMSSRDHGKSWSVGQPAYFDGSECQVAELSDGTLMLNIRNDREKFRAVMLTKDLGRSWSEHATSRKTLIEPTCNASLLRVDLEQEGRRRSMLVFANPHSQKARTHQTIQVSFDDGQSWPEAHHLLLDEGRGAGYPTLTRVDADHLGIVYEGSQSHLIFERIPFSELLQTRTAR